MKNNPFILVCLLAALLVCGCIDDPPPMVNQENPEEINFTADEAQTHFESKVIAFDQLSFLPDSRTQTRSAGLARNTLTPQWKKAKKSSNPEVTLIEIPILSSQTTVVETKWHSLSGAMIGVNRIANQKLMIAKRKSGVIQMFVVTLIPAYHYRTDQADFTEHFSYLGGGDFSGTALCATLDGTFLDAYAYRDGRKTQALKVVPTIELTKENLKPENAEYMNLRILNYEQTANSTYNAAECIHGLDTADCKECLGEATVIAKCLVCDHEGLECGCCQRCRTWYYENCEHKPCARCYNHPCTCPNLCPVCLDDPCRCIYCTKCRRPGCFGECDYYDPPLVCPYNQCRMDPCVCCSSCYGPCNCPWRICHNSPCTCCLFCRGTCRCPIGQCHQNPCLCPCYDLLNNEVDPFKGATISKDNDSWKKNVFGWNRDNGTGPGTKFHDGIDLIGQSGITPIQAMHPGTVERVVTGQPDKIKDAKGRMVYPSGYKGDKDGAGNRLTIRSTMPDGRQVDIFYWHLDIKDRNPYTHRLKAGDKIERGQVIGILGHTGNSNKDYPHLHLRIQFEGTAREDSINNPEAFLYTKFSSETGEVTRDCNNN